MKVTFSILTQWVKLGTVVSVLWIGKLRDVFLISRQAMVELWAAAWNSSSIPCPWLSFPIKSLLKVPLKYLFWLPICQHWWKFKLFTLLIHQVLHVKKMRHRKFLSAWQMTVDICCWEKERKHSFSSQDATTRSFYLFYLAHGSVP